MVERIRFFMFLTHPLYFCRLVPSMLSGPSCLSPVAAAAAASDDYFGGDFDYAFDWGRDGLGTIKLGKDTFVLRKRTMTGPVKQAWGPEPH